MIARALKSLRPGANWSLNGADLKGLEWTDKVQKRPTDAEILAEVERLRPRVAWEPVREQRDRLLAACDWTQMPDTPLSEERKAAFAEYRQALRDITASCEKPEDVVWPVAPR